MQIHRFRLSFIPLFIIIVIIIIIIIIIFLLREKDCVCFYAVMSAETEFYNPLVIEIPQRKDILKSTMWIVDALIVTF